MHIRFKMSNPEPIKPNLDDILDEPHVIGLIIFLDKEKGSLTNDMAKVSKNIKKLQEIATGLSFYGVVKITIVNNPRRTIRYELTEKGKRLAKALKEAKAIAHENAQ